MDDMQKENTNDVIILNTTREDLLLIQWLFVQAMELQGKNWYKVWTGVDQRGLEKDIESGLQYKIMRGSLYPVHIQYPV